MKIADLKIKVLQARIGEIVALHLYTTILKSVIKFKYMCIKIKSSKKLNLLSFLRRNLILQLFNFYFMGKIAISDGKMYFQVATVI